MPILSEHAQTILGRLTEVSQSGQYQWSAVCPAHDDNSPSLSFGIDYNTYLWHCHVDCKPEEIRLALNLSKDQFYGETIIYSYTDESGRELYQKVRKPNKKIYQRRKVKDTWQTSLGKVRRVLYNLPGVVQAIENNDVVWVVEGEKDANALIKLGVCATTNSEGAGSWRTEYTDTLVGAFAVKIIADKDEPGYKHASTIYRSLLEAGCSDVEVLEAKAGKDAYDHITEGYGIGDFVAAQLENKPIVHHEPIALEECHRVFKYWLGAEYDIDSLNAMLCTLAVEKIDGDPLWLMIISGSGNAKTETVQAASGDGALVTSTLSSEAALLSGTSSREVTEDATGGLLIKIGTRGTLVIKDFTSILSMQRDLRGKVLAALREIYDGRWERNLGSDGGKSLCWEGRLGFVGACTTAWDSAYSVIATMGDRFVTLRTNSNEHRMESGRQAMSNVGHEVQMRSELSSAVAAVMVGINPNCNKGLTTDEEHDLLRMANLVTWMRTAVERDYQGNVIDAHAPEMPTRFAKQLTQIVRGGLVLGMERESAVALAKRCARDSIPPLRLAVIEDVYASGEVIVADVVRHLQKPRTTIDRCLQELHMLGLLIQSNQTVATNTGNVKILWTYELEPKVDLESIKAVRP